MASDVGKDRIMAVAERLQEELRTYEKHKSELIGKGEGKWVLIHKGVISGIWDTYEDALKAGYEHYGLEPFLVKRIEGMERVLCFTRDMPWHSQIANFQTGPLPSRGLE